MKKILELKKITKLKKSIKHLKRNQHRRKISNLDDKGSWNSPEEQKQTKIVMKGFALIHPHPSSCKKNICITDILEDKEKKNRKYIESNNGWNSL